MKYCVIGLGQFGTALAIELSHQGHEVLAVDRRSAPVASIKSEVSLAAQADAADIEALRELGAHEVDGAAICIGEAFEASLMALSHLKEFGIEHIYCRVINDVHERLIGFFDVTEQIRPEAEAACQFAKRLGIESAKQRFQLTGDYMIVEVEVPEDLVGTRLADAKLREEHHLNLVTIRADGESHFTKEGSNVEKEDEDNPAGIIGVIDPDRSFERGDYLVVFGLEKHVEAFCNSKSKR